MTLGNPLSQTPGLVVIITLLALCPIAQAQSPSIWTDLPDYPPGATVFISGSGFGANEPVTMLCLHLSGNNGGAGHLPWTTYSDANGDITTTWFVDPDDSVGETFLLTADGVLSNAHAETTFTDNHVCGTGVATVTAVGGSCLAFTPAVSGGPDNWEVAQGGTYTITITGVTECSGSTITIFIQSSSTGNFCFDATGAGGTYSGTFTMPNPACNTMPISYKCGAGTDCTHPGAFAARGPNSGCNKVHLRVSNFDGSCNKTGNDTDCVDCCATPPTLTCPGDASYQCDADVPPANIEDVTATDDCGGEVTITLDSESSQGSCPKTITRTYKGVGACGNPGFCTQTITVDDTMPPDITCPPDISVPCGTSTDPSVTGSATATDNCDTNVDITFTDGPLTGTCPTGASFIRTWKATDDCLNEDTCDQIITLTPPQGQGCIMGGVVDLGGECGTAPPPHLKASMPVIGSYLTFYLDSQYPNANIALLAQGPPPPPPFNLTPECVLHVDLSNSLMITAFYTEISGDWTSRFLFTSAPELIGLTIIVQAAVIAPGGPLGVAQLTNGLQITIGSCPPICTTTKEGYTTGGILESVFDFNYASVFPAGLSIGQVDIPSGSGAPNGLFWDATATGRNALKAFLLGAGGASGALVDDGINQSLTLGGGDLALQTATLALNIAFDAAGLTGSSLPGLYGNLVFQNYPSLPDSLSGLSISQILAAANQALAGNGLPAGYTFDTLAAFIETLNLSFNGCAESFFGSKFLFNPVE